MKKHITRCLFLTLLTTMVAIPTTILADTPAFSTISSKPYILERYCDGGRLLATVYNYSTRARLTHETIGTCVSGSTYFEQCAVDNTMTRGCTSN